MGALLLLGFSIGVDNLVVGMSLGTLGVGAGRRQRLAILFGLFEAIMPYAGMLLGRRLASQFAVPWLGQGLLAATAVLILLGARHGDVFARKAGRSAWLMLLPALLSVDNLLAGSALGALGYPALPAMALTGLMSAALAAVGLYLGDAASRRVALPARLVAGSTLLVLAISGVG